MRQANNHPWRTHSLGGRPKGKGPAEVPVEKLQQAFLSSGLSKCQLARLMGWTKTIGDVHRVNITLGLENTSHGTRQRRVTYRMAVRLVKAMNVSPFDVGV